MSAAAPAPSEDLRYGVLKFFHFWPSKDIAILALTLYLVVSLTMLFMTIKTRAWYMLIAVLTALMGMAGYVCRVYMFTSPLYGVFVAMECFLIIPPSFIALVLYMTLGKVIAAIKLAHPERQTLVKPRWVIWGFFALEMLSLTCQAIGAGTSVSDSNTPPKHATLGKTLLIVGLAVLVLLMMSFIITSIYVYTSAVYGIRQSRSLSHLYIALFLTSGLLLIRNIFRLVEFSSGSFSKGYISTHEVYFYCLDSLPVFMIFCVFTVMHFGIYLQRYPYEAENEKGRSMEVV